MLVDMSVDVERATSDVERATSREDAE